MRYPLASGSSRLTRVLGWSALAALALNTWWGLWLSPPDVVQGQFVRMLYIHPAVATMCYAGFGVCALGSVAWLWPRLRSPRWDRLAVAGAEVGAVFCFATLVTGSIWGRASWGVWWTWDALTLTAILFALSLGYLALRRSIDNPHSRSLASSMGSTTTRRRSQVPVTRTTYGCRPIAWPASLAWLRTTTKRGQPGGCGHSLSGSSSGPGSGCCTPSVFATSKPSPRPCATASTIAQASPAPSTSTHPPRSPNSSAPEAITPIEYRLARVRGATADPQRPRARPVVDDIEDGTAALSRYCRPFRCRRSARCRLGMRALALAGPGCRRFARALVCRVSYGSFLSPGPVGG